MDAVAAFAATGLPGLSLGWAPGCRSTAA
ncbi:hypothetical protein ACW23B_01310 [Streptomyces albidoflavus]